MWGDESLSDSPVPPEETIRLACGPWPDENADDLELHGKSLVMLLRYRELGMCRRVAMTAERSLSHLNVITPEVDSDGRFVLESEQMGDFVDSPSDSCALGVSSDLQWIACMKIEGDEVFADVKQLSLSLLRLAPREASMAEHITVPISMSPFGSRPLVQVHFPAHSQLATFSVQYTDDDMPGELARVGSASQHCELYLMHPKLGISCVLWTTLHLTYRVRQKKQLRKQHVYQVASGAVVNCGVQYVSFMIHVGAPPPLHPQRRCWQVRHDPSAIDWQPAIVIENGESVAVRGTRSSPAHYGSAPRGGEFTIKEIKELGRGTGGLTAAVFISRQPSNVERVIDYVVRRHMERMRKQRPVYLGFKDYESDIVDVEGNRVRVIVMCVVESRWPLREEGKGRGDKESENSPQPHRSHSASTISQASQLTIPDTAAEGLTENRFHLVKFAVNWDLQSGKQVGGEVEIMRRMTSQEANSSATWYPYPRFPQPKNGRRVMDNARMLLDQNMGYTHKDVPPSLTTPSGDFSLFYDVADGPF